MHNRAAITSFAYDINKHWPEDVRGCDTPAIMLLILKMILAIDYLAMLKCTRERTLAFEMAMY